MTDRSSFRSKKIRIQASKTKYRTFTWKISWYCLWYYFIDERSPTRRKAFRYLCETSQRQWMPSVSSPSNDSPWFGPQGKGRLNTSARNIPIYLQRAQSEELYSDSIWIRGRPQQHHPYRARTNKIKTECEDRCCFLAEGGQVCGESSKRRNSLGSQILNFRLHRNQSKGANSLLLGPQT